MVDDNKFGLKSKKKHGRLIHPISQEARTFLYTLILAAIINIITSILGGVSLLALAVVPLLALALKEIYRYGQLQEQCEIELIKRVTRVARDNETSNQKDDYETFKRTERQIKKDYYKEVQDEFKRHVRTFLIYFSISTF